MRLINALILPLLFFSISANAVDGWQAYMKITDNYWSADANGPNLVLVLESNFNQCGWNGAGRISQEVVGADSFKMITSVVLTALSTNKTVSVWMSGCLGSTQTAKITGIKLGS